MSDTGWISPGTVSQYYVSGFENSWTDLNNIKSSNDSLAYASCSLYATKVVHCTGFNFNIPSGSEINGVEFSIEGYTTARDSPFGGSGVDIPGRVALEEVTDYLTTFDKTLSPILYFSDSSTQQTVTAGSSTDLWGRSLTDSDFDSNFVLSFYVDGEAGGTNHYVDHIQIKVYYTEGGTPIIGVKYPLPPFKRP